MSTQHRTSTETARTTTPTRVTRWTLVLLIPTLLLAGIWEGALLAGAILFLTEQVAKYRTQNHQISTVLAERRYTRPS